MASPEELARLKGNPQTGAVNMPGVDPITEASFQPNGPPDPGKMQPEITLPDQQIGSGFTPPLQAAVNPPNPSAFPGNPTNAAQAEIEAHPPEPVEEPTRFDSSPLNPIQKLDADSKSFAKIAEAKRNEGKAISQGKMDEAAIYSQSAQQQELALGADRQDMLKAKAAAELSEKDLSAKIAKAEAMSVDPDRYWKRKGTANNIMAAIAIGLGSFGSGLTGGATGNPALTLINNAIEHDIDAQKSDIDNYWKSIKEQKGLVDNAWNRALVMQNYNANAMLAGYKIAESKIKANAAKTDSAVTKAGMERIIAEMQPAMDTYRYQTWSTLAALEAENRKQQLAQQAARGAQITAVTKERDKSYKELREQNIKAGMDPKEASAQAWADVDQMYPQTAGTQFASPGQKYKSAVIHTADMAKGLIAQGKKMTEDQLVKGMLANGLPLEEAQERAKMVKSGDVDSLTVKLLNTSGISDPYKGINTPSSGAAIDSVTGKPVTITNKNREQIVIGPDGQQYLMPNADAAKQVRGITVLTNSIDSDLDVLKKIGKKYGGNISNWASMSKEDRLKMENARYRVAQAAAKLKNPTAEPSDDVIAQNLSNVPDVTSLASGNPEKWIENYRRSVKQDARSTFNASSGGQQMAAPPEPNETGDDEEKDPFTDPNAKKDPLTDADGSPVIPHF